MVLRVSTNLIDPAHPVTLTPHEISDRTFGSKVILLVEQCMCAVQWGTKACLLLLYWRLTQNLRQSLIVKCAALYVLVTFVVMEILYFAVWCRPFSDYWAVPTDNMQCPTALNHLITNLAFNLSSDVLIMSIPLPLFLRAHLEFKRKLLLVFPFSLGLFTMLCAILSKQYSFNSPYSSTWVYWYCREASTAMIVSNMPYSWALIRRVFKLKSFFGDSSADRMQGGEPREVNGYAAGAVALDSQARSRSASQPDNLSRVFSWPRSKRDHKGSIVDPASGKARAQGQDEEAQPADKETYLEAHPASSSNSSAGSEQRPPHVTPTDWTIDRLYPLDDIENESTDVTQRKYQG